MIEKKVITFLLLLLLLLPSFYLSGPKVNVTLSLGENWLSGWQYRKEHAIQGSIAGAQTYYQIRIIVHKGTGTDSGEHVYCNNHCRDDFGDIRFTDSDGVTLLDYWLEEYTSGDKATFWVEIPSIPASPDTTTIYIYYGNPEATTISDGDATFLLFDHFEFKDTTKWDFATPGTYSGYSISNSILNLYSGLYGKTKGWNIGFWVRSKSTFQHDVMVEMLFDGRMGGTVYDASNYRSIRSVVGYRILDESNKAKYSVGRGHSTNHYLKIARFSDNAYLYQETPWDGSLQGYKVLSMGIYGGKIYLYEERSLKTSVSTAIPDPWKLMLVENPAWYNGDGWAEILVDWVFVRKFVDPEPSHGSWGSEEQPNQPPNAPILNLPSANERFDPSVSVTFTWTFNDPDAGDAQSAYRFQLDDNSDFSSPIIDTGKVSSSENSTTQVLPSMVGLYYWRVKTWDSFDAESDWSEARPIIVDCFNVKTIKVQDDRVDTSASVNIWFEVCRAYDDAVFDSDSGVVYVNGSETVWDSVVGAWKATVSMDTVGEARFAISSIIDNEYGITTINAMLRFDGIDDYVQTSTVPNPFSAEQTIIAWVRGEPEDTVYSKIYYGKDYPGEVGENWYDPSVGREVRRVLVGTSAGYLCDGISVPVGFNGPFALTTYSKVTDNTQSLLAWKVEVWENGVLKYSYSAYADQLQTTYTWRESPTWWFNGSKSYEIKVYWPGNVDLYLERVSILARRGGIGYGSVYPSSMLFRKPEQDKIQIGYYTRKSDGSYSWIWFSSATIPIDSNFHQVAVTLGGGIKSLYIDGLLRQQVSGQGDLYPADTYFKISGIWRYFYGIIDEVYIYNRSLSSEEIKQVYLGEKITEGLILHFSGHIANGIIYDDSGNNNHGTLYGPTLDFTSRQSPAIIWDRIKIITGGVVDLTIDVDIGGKIWYYAVYEYDNATFDDSCGVLYLNGFEMTWDGEKWIYAFPYSTEGNQMTFHITGVLDNQYGLTEINNQAGDITINWATMTIEIKK